MNTAAPDPRLAHRRLARIWLLVLLLGAATLLAAPAVHFVRFKVEAARLLKEAEQAGDPPPTIDPVISFHPTYWQLAAGGAIALAGLIGIAWLTGIIHMLRRSLRQHALSSLVTIISVALAAGLLMAVFSIKQQTHNAFTSGATGFDAVLGARGSQLQVILNSVFHLETSTGNMPYEAYTAIKADPRVKVAIPYAVGDNYRGYRVVGTTGEFFREYEYGSRDNLKKLTFEGEGRMFNELRAEAVIGSMVAANTDLNYGSVFNTYHGLTFDPDAVHTTEFVVTGVLKPTGTPIDRVIWIPLEGYYRMGGHEPVDPKTGKRVQPKPGVPIPDEYKEVSSVMLKLRSPSGGASLDTQINRQGNVRTLAWPVGKVMADLFGKIAWANQVLEFVAYLVAVVAGAAILASIYNTMNERRREFAIMRAIGARRSTVFSAIVAESATIAALGSLLGFVVYAVLLGIAAAIIRAKSGVVLDITEYHEALVLTPLGMTALGAITGLVPAWKAYATDVATNLAPAS
jgi:putative ABC transport system permease protein